MSETLITQHSESHGQDAGKLLLRLSLGSLLLFHGISKVFGGIDFILGALGQAGVPGALGYFVYIGEVVAPVLLIVGIWTRMGALIVIVNMIVAVALAHTGQLFSLSKSGGYALELQAFYFLTAASIAVLGAGRYSLAGADGKWN